MKTAELHAGKSSGLSLAKHEISDPWLTRRRPLVFPLKWRAGCSPAESGWKPNLQSRDSPALAIKVNLTNALDSRQHIIRRLAADAHQFGADNSRYEIAG